MIDKLLHMKRFAILFLLFSYTLALAQQPSSVKGQRIYSMTIAERDPLRQDAFSEQLRGELEQRDSRGFSETVFNTYRASMSSLFGDVVGKVANVAVGYAVSAIQGHQKDWERTIKKECTFSKDLKMLSEMHHFYDEASTIGPLDPSGMVFEGFSCRQDIRIDDQIVNVFNLVCKVRTDSLGLQSIVSDSKFLVYVDEVSFNPFLCDLPNDSLENAALRIPFDFERRKDLKLQLQATVTSSWMNQVLQIFRDQELGRFNVTVKVDPSRIVTDSTGAQVFRYKYAPDNPDNRLVSVSGDCFLVPRSYVASKEDCDVWGMGQYKVDMRVFETCTINPDYYTENGKWQKDKWMPEWKTIRQRPGTRNFWTDVADAVSQDFKDGKWVVKATTPISSTIIQEGKTFINGKR